MVKHQAYYSMTAATLTAFLAGCGGGSSPVDGGFIEGSTTTTTSTLAASNAEGLFTGTASNGRYFNTLVLENNQYYIIYGGLSNDIFSVAGVVTGTGQPSNGNFTSSDLREFPALGLPILGTLSGTYTPGTSFSAVVTTRGTAVTYPGSVPDKTTYIYNTPAKLSDIAGAWTMTLATGLPVSLNIASGGTYTGSSVGCDFSGTITPRAGGKNVFDLTIRFGPPPCVLADQSATGHAVSYLLANGKRQLIAIASDASRNNTTVVLGAR